MLSFHYLGYHVSVSLLDSSYPDAFWQATCAPWPTGGLRWHGPLSECLGVVQQELRARARDDGSRLFAPEAWAHQRDYER